MAIPNVLLRAVREAKPSQVVPGECMSRAELADAVNRYLLKTTGKTYELDRHQVARYERGEVRWPRAQYRAGMRAVLGVSRDADLGFTPRSQTRDTGQTSPVQQTDSSWQATDVVAAAEEITRQDVTLTRRQALASASGIAAGAALTGPLQRWLLPLDTSTSGTSALSESEIAGWEQVTAQFRGWSNQPTGLLVRKAVIGQLNEISDRLRNAPNRPLTNRGFLVGAELAEIAGSMSWDAGLHRSAQRYYTLAVQFAKIAHDDGFAAVTLAALARQCFDLGSPDDGLELVQLAQYGTRKTAGSAMRSLLATREAWAYAQSGQVQPFRRAVGLAEEHYADDDQRPADRWVTGFDRAELFGVIGARYRDLAKHDASQARKAQDYIVRALDLRDPSRARNRCFDLIGLARAHLISAEPDRACELIEQAVPMARQWATGRVGSKLRDFHRESTSYADVQAVKHTREAIRELIAV